tara:strand:- start:90 stop:665 length:576 start_codon:yes stop_codon:yes gene_type:complete
MWHHLPFRNDIFRLIITTKSSYNSLSPAKRDGKNFIIIGKKNLIIRHDYKNDKYNIKSSQFAKPVITDLDDNKYKIILKKIKEHIKYFKLKNNDYLFKFKDSYYNEKNMDSNMKKYLEKHLNGVKINQTVLCKAMIHFKTKNKSMDDKVRILHEISEARPTSFKTLCLKYEINPEFLKNYSNNSESTDLSD